MTFLAIARNKLNFNVKLCDVFFFPPASSVFTFFPQKFTSVMLGERSKPKSFSNVGSGVNSIAHSGSRAILQ